LYEFNPRSLFLNELKALLEKVLEYYPEEVREDLLINRRRPRKKDKPLSNLSVRYPGGSWLPVLIHISK
jgi:hypothetical protein